MSRNALAIRHVPFEDLGTFAPVLAQHGYEIAYVDAGCDGFDAARHADLVVLLGGPVSVNDEERYPWLRAEIELAGHCIARSIPLLGICLGAQLIARSLGARVNPAQAKEIGLTPIILTDAGKASPLAALAGKASPLAALAGGPVLHWHGETFDLPDGADRLASTEICENQAFSLGPRVLACQFHPEACDGRFERWLIGHHCELEAAGIDINALRADELRERQALRNRGDMFLTAWLDRLG